MGVDPATLGKAYRKALAREIAAGKLPAKVDRKRPAGELRLIEQLRAAGIAGYQEHYKLIPGRDIEADFAWVDWQGYQPEPVRVQSQDRFRARLRRITGRPPEMEEIVFRLHDVPLDGWAYLQYIGGNRWRQISEIEYPPGECLRADWIEEELFWVGIPEDPRSLAVFIDGSGHVFSKAGDGLGGTGKGKRSRDCERQNILPLLCPGWTVLYFTPAQVARCMALHAIQAWLAGDDERLVEVLQTVKTPAEAFARKRRRK